MPVATEARSWENRRSAFRHDWLKNRYLNSLRALLSLLDESNPDCEWLLEIVEEDLPIWEKKKEEARWVIDAYEDEMSPRTLMDRPPLSNCSSESQKWLGALIHRLWRHRYDIPEDTKNAREALDQANDKYDQLVSQIDGTPNVNQLKVLRPQFEAFKEACVELDDTMSNFLNEVKTV